MNATLDLFDDPPVPGAPTTGGLFGDGRRWFSVPAHRPFLHDLARGLWTRLGEEGPQALSDAVVLLPNRRAARELAAAFTGAAGGRAVLLPQIRTLGDLDEGEPPFEPGDAALDLPPAVTAGRRRFELARLVVEHQHLLRRTLDAAAALDLADALAAFLDAVQIEEADASRVEGLVEGELARHWEISARFLDIAVRAWPARLEELGLVDVSARRIALLRALADQWRARPPEHPLVAAGSTGSAPASADLLAAVAAAPRGAVVLPGLDLDLADDAWAQVGEAHPQGALRRLLARAGVERADVRPWPAEETAADAARGRARRRVVNEALRPPEATADWLRLIGDLEAEGAVAGADPVAEGLEGLTVLSARTEEDAAAQAALLLREALETPGRTAALVTPDPALARRVSARLSRWGVVADSSAGAPLPAFPAGVVLTLLARAAADPLDPSTLLALAKHPLARLGRNAATLDLARRRFERRGLRGPRPRAWTELQAHLAEEPEALALAEALRAALDHARAPFSAEAVASAPLAARALAEALELLASDADGRLGELWAGPGGEAAAALLAGLMEDGAGLPACTVLGFAQVVEALAAREVVRTGGALHPRLRILGLIEARLVRADLLVLAGLEEGVWPRPAPTDPFLSRPMRSALGLPPPERRTGQAAHDFAQAACAPQVAMIHAERRGGAPAVKSRWLWRLETLARGAGSELPGRPEVARWAAALDAPLAPTPPSLRLARRPAPTPPVEARPRELAVTRVEEWIRDPYATYARYVLRLRALARPDEPVEARARGEAVHAAFQRFVDDALDEGAPARFEALLAEALHTAGLPGWRMARERALASNLARWAVEFETARRDGAELHVEMTGKLALPAPHAPFVVSAKADRLERRPGRTDVLDFKTGAAPSSKQVESGFSPQLTLTAAILAQGGFEAVGSSEPGELAYVRVTGRREPGRAEVRGEAGGHSRELAVRAMEGLLARVARFDDPSTPYLSWAAPQFLGRIRGDYDHLARLWEWRVMGEAGGDGETAGSEA